MKISQFISHALFDSASGYYRTKNPLGKNSDFITAPEISQIFGELVAAYILQIFSTKKNKISVVEMGAGRGVMMRDILTTVKKLAEKKNSPALDFIESASLHIIEINEVLKKIQQESLREFDLKWHESFADFLPKSEEIFFISNELFDCFPIDQFVLTELGWRERIVVGRNFTLANFDKKIHQFIEKEINQLAPIGAVLEYSKAARDFMTQLCEALKIKGGMAINFDYGYCKNNFANTLQAIKNHQKVGIFEEACDITAHVDFSALNKIAENSGLNSSLISQREFLLALGIEERRKVLSAKDPQINSAIDRLIAPDQMGELFKCHIIWK